MLSFVDEQKEADHHLIRTLKLATIHAMTGPNLSRGGHMSTRHVQVQDIVQDWETVRADEAVGGARRPPFDIIFKLLSSALDSTSCVLDTALNATMF